MCQVIRHAVASEPTFDKMMQNIKFTQTDFMDQSREVLIRGSKVTIETLQLKESPKVQICKIDCILCSQTSGVSGLIQSANIEFV